MKAIEIIEYMESLRNEKQRSILMRFFKTAPGEYGYGDEFLGLKVPQTREVVKAARDLPLSEVPELLMNRWHEVRLCGFLILVARFEQLATKRKTNDMSAILERDEIVMLYLQYARRANNWDLVDLSVHKIIGNWLLLPTCLKAPVVIPQENETPALVSKENEHEGNIINIDELSSEGRKVKMWVMDMLASSDCLWMQRMSMVCTWKTSQQGDPSWCLRYAERHLHHSHDLMHKAVGWMLREMGKRVDMDLLRNFLEKHCDEMPRTMLRYSIEKMDEKERQWWLSHRYQDNNT